jgi:hypothetical protein
MPAIDPPASFASRAKARTAINVPIEDAAFAVRIGSPENQEALRAFFEKRPADFKKVPPTDRE